MRYFLYCKQHKDIISRIERIDIFFPRNVDYYNSPEVLKNGINYGGKWIEEKYIFKSKIEAEEYLRKILIVRGFFGKDFVNLPIDLILNTLNILIVSQDDLMLMDII